MWTDPNSPESGQLGGSLRPADFAFLKQRAWLALTLLVIVLVPLFWRLSDWQFHRFAERRATNAAVLSASKKAPIALDQALASSTKFADWTPVTATGTWLAGTAMARKHWRNDVMGFWAVSHLNTNQGTLLVVRGWLPTTKSAATTPDDPGLPTEAPAVLSGWLVKPEQGEQPQNMPAGQIAHVNAPSFTTAVAEPDAPIRPEAILVIDHTRTPRSAYAASAGLFDIHPPDLGDGPHHSYAWQWRAFIVLVLVGWARLAFVEARGLQRTSS